jgi:hypothetical protein
MEQKQLQAQHVLTEATIFVHVLMKTEEMTSWTPDENFSIL